MHISNLRLRVSTRYTLPCLILFYAYAGIKVSKPILTELKKNSKIIYMPF